MELYLTPLLSLYIMAYEKLSFAFNALAFKIFISLSMLPLLCFVFSFMITDSSGSSDT
jgi:hypothetical protein